MKIPGGHFTGELVASVGGGPAIDPRLAGSEGGACGSGSAGGQARPGSAPESGPAATIPIVDDHPINLKLISGALGFEGHRVLKAVDADEAQAILAKAPRDLILMDLALPGMDGLTLTRRLKAEPVSQAIRVVARTAFAMKADEQRTLAGRDPAWPSRSTRANCPGRSSAGCSPSA
jgi:two-component system cell cycle response regulator DivK